MDGKGPARDRGGREEEASSPGRAVENEKDFLSRLWRAAAPHQLGPQLHLQRAAKHSAETNRRTSAPTVLFDSEYYLSQLPWFVRAEIDPLAHYLETGWAIGLSPHIAFDSAHVARQLGIETWTQPPLLAYFETETEVSAHPLFDIQIYARHVSLSGQPCARLFELFIGSWEIARAPFSRLFSACFYGKAEPVADRANANPLVHYLMTAPARRRDPSPMIHNRWYDQNYPAGRGQPSDALIRFATCGLAAGHSPNPFAAHELRMRDADSRIPRALLERYVDVSAMDEAWFGTSARERQQRESRHDAGAGEHGPVVDTTRDGADFPKRARPVAAA